METRILLIDDDLLEAEKLQASLQRAGFSVLVAPPNRKALRLVKTQKPVLVILGLNGRNGEHLQFNQSLQRAIGQTPVVLIPPEEMSVPSADNQKVLQRPVTTRKVMHQVRRLLRNDKPRSIKRGEMVLDYESQCVWTGGEKRALTPKEFKLMELFMIRPGQVLSKKEIMQLVWETGYMGDIRTLYVHVRWLRRKLEADPCHPKYIRTVRGIGYLFDCPAAPAT
jgi:DNA-binding response OmpR family regulator